VLRKDLEYKVLLLGQLEKLEELLDSGGILLSYNDIYEEDPKKDFKTIEPVRGGILEENLKRVVEDEISRLLELIGIEEEVGLLDSRDF
jgi:hypothetical protein